MKYFCMLFKRYHYEKHFLLLVVFFAVLIGPLFVEAQKKSSSPKTSKKVEVLPDGLKWETNQKDPIYSSSEAQPGSTMILFIPTFPLTIRTIGPDSNIYFRAYFSDNNWSLITLHPNTRNIIPLLAESWAFGKDKHSMFFKIHPKAKWSDGVPVTVDDFLFMIEMMKSKHIIDPIVNDYIEKHIEKVIKYDNKTIGVFAKKPYPRLEQYVNFAPRPKHFYKGKIPKDFVKRYNWKEEPVTGPYLLTKIRKGKSFTFEKQKDWWAQNLRYIKNRFNPKRLIVKVVRDEAVTYELFKKGRSDVFEAMTPERWYLKCQGEEFDKGYIEKTTYYTDSPRSNRGFYLNTSNSLFENTQIKYAFAHAMDVDTSIKKIFRGDVYRLERPYTGYGDYENISIKARKYDIKRVERIMKSLGWKRDKNGIWVKGKQRFSVKVTHSYAIYSDYLSFLKEQAKKAGVELILDFLDGATAFKKVKEKNHEATFWAWSTGLIPAPWQMFHSINAKPGTNNISNTSDKKLDKLIDQYRDTSDQKQHIKLAKDIAKRIHDLGDFIPSHYFPFVRTCHWRWMRLPKGGAATLLSQQAIFDSTDPSTGGLFWIDAKMKKETLSAKKKGKTFSPVNRVENKK